MGFGEAISSCFEKYGTFKGRAARSEYWYFVLFGMLVGIVTIILDSLSFGALSTTRPFQGFGSLALAVPAAAVAARRLHDLDRTGLWLIPAFALWLYNILISLVFGQPDFRHLGQIGATAMGWLLFAAFLYSIGLLIVMTFRGTTGPNRFGADPLASAEVQPISPAPAV